VSSERRAGFILGGVIGFAAGLLLAATGLFDVEDVIVGNDSLSDEAAQTIEDSYWKNVDSSKLDDASVRGMVNELKDRYDDRNTHYFNPKQFRRFNQSTSGRFSGVGLSVSEVKRGLRVATVFAGTPAKRAGIEEGDVITGVDGKSIAGEPADVATAKIKGPPGTEVRIRVLRPSTGKSRELKLERARVQIPAVRGELRRAGGDKVAYVQLAGFSEGVHGELRSELERLYARGAEGLVLDLRGNGGGLLNEAVLTSSVFVKKGVIATTEGRTQPRTDYDAVGGALAPRPTVVLINGDTASAAEILTAALKERGLATVVGTRSFGKGTFQEVIRLDAGGAIDLTVGEYLTSNGRSLADKGIKPNVRVQDDRRTKPDEGLQRGLQVLEQKLAGSG
jgi:carboxyl-terminal processing protease